MAESIQTPDLRPVRRALDSALMAFARGGLPIAELVNQVFWVGVRYGRRAAADDLEAWEREQRRRDFEGLIKTLRERVLREAAECRAGD